MTSSCPTDDELLALATGDTGSAGTGPHVEACSSCARRLAELESLVVLFRANAAVPLGRQPGSEAGTSFARAREVSGPAVDGTISKPRTIGRYIVIGELRGGGQAEVFRVVDPGLGRTLILKLARATVGDGDAGRDDILAEGRLLAEMSHPNLVQVLDAGVHQGRPYCVMEHVYGRNLEELHSAGLLSPRTAARIMAAIARVTAFAHRRGVFHGDITPRNILIDQDGKPRLIDFGMATISRAREAGGDTPGGTIGFLAPEAARGESGRAAASCDIFGLGATLYWLITGAAPFSAVTASEAIDRARRCDFDIDALRAAHASRRLRRAVLHAMAPRPAARPQTAERWADELAQAVSSWKRPGVRVSAALAALALTSALTWWWSGAQLNRQNLYQPHFADSGKPAALPFRVAPPSVTVLRGQTAMTMAAALPLRDGDRIGITFEVPKGLRAHLLWYDQSGRLSNLLPPVEHTATTDRYAYPGFGQYARLEPGAGTQLFLLCVGARLFDQRVEECFPTPVPLRQLPDRAYLAVDGTRVDGAGVRDGSAGDALEVSREELERVCRSLSERFPTVVGFALPQNDAAPATPGKRD